MQCVPKPKMHEMTTEAKTVRGRVKAKSYRVTPCFDWKE